MEKDAYNARKFSQLSYWLSWREMNKIYESNNIKTLEKSIWQTCPTENKQNKRRGFFAEKLLATALTDASTNLKGIIGGSKNVGFWGANDFFALSNQKKIEKRHINPQTHILQLWRGFGRYYYYILGYTIGYPVYGMKSVTWFHQNSLPWEGLYIYPTICSWFLWDQ